MTPARHPLLRVALALVLSIVGCDSSRAPVEGGSMRTPSPRASVAARPRTEGELRVVEIVTGGADRNARLPLIVAIHGLGDRPEAFAGVFDGFSSKARIVLPRAPQRWGRGWAWFPFHRNDSPELRARGIDTAAARVVATMKSIATRRPTRGKPIVTGFSQGGMLSFAIAAEHPDLVRAAFPVGGVLPRQLWPKIRGGGPRLRVVALHGESDPLVPIGPTKSGVSALVAHGFDARLESFPGVGHAIPPPERQRWLELLAEELAREP